MAAIPELDNNVLGYPIRYVPWCLVFPLYDASGGLVTGATGLDSKISKNGNTPVDCTNEAVEIGLGLYALILTQAEMSYGCVAVVTSSTTTGAKSTPQVLYPVYLIGIGTGTCQSPFSTDTVRLDPGNSPSPLDSYYTGCILVVNIDGVKQARMIYGYDGVGLGADVESLSILPDADDTYVIYVPPGRYMSVANVHAIDESEFAARQQALAGITTHYGTVGTGPTTTTMVDTALTQTQVDHWKARIIFFTSGGLAKQATRITGFNPATDTLTFEALSAAPTAGDKYIIL